MPDTKIIEYERDEDTDDDIARASGAADAGEAGGGAGAVMDASVEVNSAAPIAGSE